MKLHLKINNPMPDGGVKIVKLHLYRQAVVTFASCLISICGGLTFGITAVMLPQLREDKTIQYDATYDSWIASSATLAMIIGSLVCGPILDSYGRRITHIILGITFVIGWTLIGCANSTNLILAGRVITGLASGANRPVSMVYIGEIADPKFRTAALFISPAMANLGILLSHIVGHYLTWNNTAFGCVLPAIITCVTFLFLKESPLWLIAKGRTEEGIESFRWFRGTDEASESELKVILQRQNEKPKISAKETFNAVRSMYFIKPMLVLMFLMMTTQLSGSSVFVFYTQDIFEAAFSRYADAFLLVVVFDCIRVIVGICCCLIGKMVPKKNACLSCTFGVSVFALGLVACFVTKTESMWLPTLCLAMYLGFTSAIVSIGSSFAPELLPSSTRGFGSGLNSAFAFINTFFVIKTLPGFMSAYGATGLFSFFGVSMAVCGPILNFILPETNGKTLQSIEDSYNKNKTSDSITVQ